MREYMDELDECVGIVAYPSTEGSVFATGCRLSSAVLMEGMVKTWPAVLAAREPNAGRLAKAGNCWAPVSKVAGGGKTGGFWRLQC